MNVAPRIDSYEWRGGREPMLRFGPQDGPVVVLALPLFEEANRTRAFGVAILRALAERGIGGVLPELPGQGESELPTAKLRLADLRDAFAAAPGSHALSVRSGAILLDDERPCWQLSPQTRPDLLRELSRLRESASWEATSLIAGNAVSGEFVAELSADHSRAGGDPVAAGAQLSRRLRKGDRLVRLASDSRPAELYVDGPPLWRRVEPDNDVSLVQILAADIAAWVPTCAS